MEELQKLCNNLSEILSKMENIVRELESVEDKCVGLTQLCDMSSTSFNKSQAAANKSSNTSVLSSSCSEKSHNSSLIELDNSVVYTSDITRWTQTIIECHKNQLRMNEIVSKNICHLETRDEALFHQSVWSCQPAMATEYDAAVTAVELTLKSFLPESPVKSLSIKS